VDILFYDSIHIHRSDESLIIPHSRYVSLCALNKGGTKALLELALTFTSPSLPLSSRIPERDFVLGPLKEYVLHNYPLL
jgi:7,8-dihydro-6-hydroxymethylpterin-pyrophosphokinase